MTYLHPGSNNYLVPCNVLALLKGLKQAFSSTVLFERVARGFS
jgi:hypothetical protein